MGKGLIAISIENGEIKMKTFYENMISNELAELILNLEILTEDLRVLYRTTIKKSENKF